ncbi:hypothetical protein GCK32_014640 [Trichostrongylus colubriformis]|uniref:Uncharacterized protein n=1 Tax=Trichostrongylus colubriformis TaxID=6319 RepID=A0AAN8G0Q5_TRICO
MVCGDRIPVGGMSHAQVRAPESRSITHTQRTLRVSHEAPPPTISMEPHIINSYLLLTVGILLLMVVLVTVLNLVQPPIRRLFKWYFPGEQDYEIMA